MCCVYINHACGCTHTITSEILVIVGEGERNGRHHSDRQTVQHSVQQPGRSLLFSTVQSNADKRKLDRERCLSHPVASLGESWDRYPRAQSWRLCSRSLMSLGVSILCLRDPALGLMKY